MAIDFAEEVVNTKISKRRNVFTYIAIKRASDSISLNIAEGSIGQSDAEQKKFIGYSIRSLAECINCLYLSKRRKYITLEEFQLFDKRSEELFAKMNKFRSSLGS